MRDSGSPCWGVIAVSSWRARNHCFFKAFDLLLRTVFLTFYPMWSWSLKRKPFPSYICRSRNDTSTFLIELDRAVARLIPFQYPVVVSVLLHAAGAHPDLYVHVKQYNISCQAFTDAESRNVDSVFVSKHPGVTRLPKVVWMNMQWSFLLRRFWHRVEFAKLCIP